MPNLAGKVAFKILQSATAYSDHDLLPPKEAGTCQAWADETPCACSWKPLLPIVDGSRGRMFACVANSRLRLSALLSMPNIAFSSVPHVALG